MQATALNDHLERWNALFIDFHHTVSIIINL